MAQFKLLAGKHHYGAAKTGQRTTVNPGETFETDNEKEIVFCRKYPDKYEDLTPPEPKKGVEPKEIKKRPIKGKIDVDNVVPETPKPVTETVEVDMDKLKKMTDRDLLMFCRANNIDVKGATKKEDILKRIKESTEEV